MPDTIFRGCGFEDCYIAMPSSGAIYMAPLISIATGDDLTIGGEIKVYDGAPIGVFHGDTQVGTVNNSGPFTRQFITGDDASECSLRSTGDSDHQVGYLEITRA